jgi:beta-glucosidase
VAEGHAAGREDFAEAVSAANGAEVVILVLGEPAGWSGENSSRSTLGVTGRQMELFDAVVATGKAVIVVLINGRPLAIPQIHEKAAAVLEAWQPGVQGGHGVADVLFGDVEPAGRLTASFPRSVGQLPVHYNHFNTGRPDMGKYVDGPREPLYPFGHGLSYTTFEYGKVQLSARSIRPDETLTARVTVKNTGARNGTEVVQLYLRDVAASAGPRPVRELKGFQKVRLSPGESREATFTIGGEELGYCNMDGDWLVEPGTFELWIAGNSASGELTAFAIADR